MLLEDEKPFQQDAKSMGSVSVSQGTNHFRCFKLRGI